LTTGQETFGTQIFVQERPVDSLAHTVKPPSIALLFGALLKARIPGQRERDRTTVVEIDDERV
jgi:hypothetical protein